MAKAFEMLRQHQLSDIHVAAIADYGMQQFYFLGTGQFLQDRGVSGKYVSAIMALAQVSQAIATICLLGRLLAWPKDHGYDPNTGYQLLFIIGSLCWSVLFLVYILTKNKLLLRSLSFSRLGLCLFRDWRSKVYQ